MSQLTYYYKHIDLKGLEYEKIINNRITKMYLINQVII